MLREGGESPPASLRLPRGRRACSGGSVGLWAVSPPRSQDARCLSLGTRCWGAQSPAGLAACRLLGVAPSGCSRTGVPQAVKHFVHVRSPQKPALLLLGRDKHWLAGLAAHRLLRHVQGHAQGESVRLAGGEAARRSPFHTRTPVLVSVRGFVASGCRAVGPALPGARLSSQGEAGTGALCQRLLLILLSLFLEKSCLLASGRRLVLFPLPASARLQEPTGDLQVLLAVPAK